MTAVPLGVGRVRDAGTRVWTWGRVKVVGLPHIASGLAVLGFLASDTPSLLPRPWYYQGLIAGLSALAFLVVGLVFDELWRLFKRWSHLRVEMRPTARRAIRRIVGVLIVLAMLLYPFVNRAWHVVILQYVGEPDPGPLYALLGALTGIAVLGVFLSLWHLIVMLSHWLTRRVEKRNVRATVAKLVATGLTIVIVGIIVDQLVARGLVIAKSQAATVNAAVPQGLQTPTSALRSGGPQSLVSWDSIGADAKSFIGSGPTAAKIAAATGDSTKEPIRVIASVSRTQTVEQTTNVVLKEMDRTDAWSRKAILVVASTSTGYVNERAAASFEYLMRGDSAIVTIQYSTLPSALGFLTDAQQPPRVARQFFDAVSSVARARPEGSRPKLYASGESLGAYGGNGAYDSPADMLAKVDGALWTGTPSFTPMHEELTAARAFGSTTVNPTVDGGAHIRFVGNPKEITADQFGHAYGEWAYPRVVYLQHDTDPVVWWSSDLLFSTPSWLNETTTPGTPMSYMGWLPVVTFWQVTADMAMSNSVPGGYGHRYYEQETVPSWAGVLGMDPSADYSRIEAAIKADNGDSDAG